MPSPERGRGGGGRRGGRRARVAFEAELVLKRAEQLVVPLHLLFLQQRQLPSRARGGRRRPRSEASPPLGGALCVAGPRPVHGASGFILRTRMRGRRGARRRGRGGRLPCGRRGGRCVCHPLVPASLCCSSPSTTTRPSSQGFVEKPGVHGGPLRRGRGRGLQVVAAFGDSHQVALVGVAGQQVFHFLVGAERVLDATGQRVTFIRLRREGEEKKDKREGERARRTLIKSFHFFLSSSGLMKSPLYH